MTTSPAPSLAPSKTRLKGPEIRVGADGDWSPGLLRSRAYEDPPSAYR
jgi:hypothetical protein